LSFRNRFAARGGLSSSFTPFLSVDFLAQMAAIIRLTPSFRALVDGKKVIGKLFY